MLKEGAIEPDQVADDVVKAMAEEKFMILPHPEAGKFFQNKANDYQRWIRGMQKCCRGILSTATEAQQSVLKSATDRRKSAKN